MKVQWQLTYRSPIADSKGVDNVLIETNSTHEHVAREVATYWLETHRAHPSTRFVAIRQIVVQTEDDMRREQTQAREAEEHERAEDAKSRAKDQGKPARVGA